MSETFSAELMSMEPPLARVFRKLLETEGRVTVSALDGSSVFGKVTDVAEDGTTATITRLGDADYIFDIAAVTVIKIAH